MNTTRFLTRNIVCESEFVTPAFLGGADYSAELRAAPFKAALRWWWRVLLGQSISDDELWTKESEIFGSTEAASKVRINVSELEVKPPVAKNSLKGRKVPVEGKTYEIDILNYLAFGLCETAKAISPKSTFRFSVSVPDNLRDQIALCLKALFTFGGVGARARNGFGALRCLNELPIVTAPLFAERAPKEYPILSKDSKLFRTKQCYSRWEDALSGIGIIYRCVRHALENKHTFTRRGLLARPIEAKKERVPNELRIQRSPKQLIMRVNCEGIDKYYGQILTLPIIFYEPDKQEDYRKVISDVHEKLLERGMMDKTDKLFDQLGRKR